MLRAVGAVAFAGFLSVSTIAEAQIFGPTVRRDREITTEDMTRLNPRLPRDVYRPGAKRGPDHEDLAVFAWLEFIALNVQANQDRRGQPAGSFRDSGFPVGGTQLPLLWETFQHRSELFPFNNNQPVGPLPFNEPPDYNFSVNGQAYNPGLSLFNNLDEASQIGQNMVFFPSRREGGEDQQVLFQAKANQVQSDYLAANFSTLTPPIDLPNGSIEVKTAWRPLQSIPFRERGRYHVAEAIFYDNEDGDPVAQTGTFALIGMHIMHKTRNFPTWVFATFEHVDILQRQTNGRDTGFYYVPTYDEITFSLPATTDVKFPTAQTVDNPDLRLFNVNRPRVRPNGRPVRLPVGSAEDIDGAVVVDDDVQVPVVQPPSTNDAVAAANAQALAAMQAIPGFDDSFIWQNYRLKGVQGVPRNRQSREDFFLANIAIESSQPGLQLWRGQIDITTDQSSGITTLDVPQNQINIFDPVQDAFVSGGGCIGCHGIAQTLIGQDFSYLLGRRDGAGFSPQTVGLKDEETQQDRIDQFPLLDEQ